MRIEALTSHRSNPFERMTAHARKEVRMSNRVTVKQLVKQIPSEIREILGDPPIVQGESEEIYWGMIASFARFVAPTDFIAWLLIKDLVDARVEIHRYRKYKVELMGLPRERQIEEQISIWKGSVEGHPQAFRKQATAQKEELANSGKTPEEIQKLSRRIDQQVEAKCREAEAYARQQVVNWSNVGTKDRDVAALYREWTGPVDRMDSGLVAAEKKYAQARVELERYLRGQESLLWEAMAASQVIDMPKSDADKTAPQLEPSRLAKIGSREPGAGELLEESQLGARERKPTASEGSLTKVIRKFFRAA
jgi:hypothetical protein